LADKFIKYFQLIIFIIAIGCGVIIAQPTKLTSEPTIGTVRIFEASEVDVNSAITNAFGSNRYNDMLLGQAIGHDFLARSWHPTNGFLLQPGTFSSYHGYLFIGATLIASNQTKVVVRTIVAEAINGKEPGIHGGWAFHFQKIPPNLQEETNVLTEIFRYLNSEKNSSMKIRLFMQSQSDDRISQRRQSLVCFRQNFCP
jgi:hypothetical protein